MAEVKVRSIVVDTLTAIQEKQLMRDYRKPGFDEWTDYGKAIYIFMDDLINRGFEIIFILGEPGTGKSSGMRTLEPGTNIWFNSDAKNPTWGGTGITEYGKKSAPRLPFHLIPTDYSEILAHIDYTQNKGKFEGDKFAFLIAHTETYKVGVQNRERLKTLGKLATKMQLEGRTETVLYSRVERSAGKTSFMLETQSDGFNTARSHLGMFEGKIPNDYNYILKKLTYQEAGEPVK